MATNDITEADEQAITDARETAQFAPEDRRGMILAAIEERDMQVVHAFLEAGV